MTPEYEKSGNCWENYIYPEEYSVGMLRGYIQVE